MALHRLTSITMGVPNVAGTAAYYAEFGLSPDGDGWFTTRDAGRQLAHDLELLRLLRDALGLLALLVGAFAQDLLGAKGRQRIALRVRGALDVLDRERHGEAEQDPQRQRESGRARPRERLGQRHRRRVGNREHVGDHPRAGHGDAREQQRDDGGEDWSAMDHRASFGYLGPLGLRITSN